MKIGFVAVSGVRVHDEELTRLGLTLPGFVERSKVIASLPSLGLLTLAGMTPAPFEIAYHEVPNPLTVDPLPGAFDAVAISSYSAQIREAYTLADRYRAAGVTVILGGPHVTAVPGEAALHADAVVLGEGEPLWPSLLRDLASRRLQPVYDARGLDFDLAESPMPRFDLLDTNVYNRLTVQTHRGCRLDCEFCAASIRMSPRFKTKPVERVIAEIRRIKEIWPRPFIEFADDNTFASMRHGRELVRALIPEGIRWFTETDISVARDETLLAMMKESGCQQILIGLESPVAQGLDGLELRSNWKRTQLEGYAEAIARIQDHGITVNGCFILGLDNTDASSFERIWEFVNASGLYEVQLTVLTPFPGTPLYRRLLEEGRILRDGDWASCTLFDVNFRPQHMTVEELEGGLRSLMQRVYSDECTASRKKRFFDRLRERSRSSSAVATTTTTH
jgi:radical SAM superfamily enzyme YgiQ (UPF0313 family)